MKLAKCVAYMIRGSLWGASLGAILIYGAYALACASAPDDIGKDVIEAIDRANARIDALPDDSPLKLRRDELRGDVADDARIVIEAIQMLKEVAR